MRVALIGAYAAAPLAVAPGLLLAFDITPKTVLVLCAAALALAFPGAAWPGLRTAWRDRAGRWFLICLGAHAAAALLATAFSSNPALSFAGSRWRQLGLPMELALCVLAAAVLGWVWGRAERRGLLLDAVAFAAVPISGYAMLQYFGIDPFLPAGLYYAGDEEWAVVRPPSTFGHAGYFATWAASAVFLIAGRARESGGVWRYVSAGLLVLAVILSGTRGALVGMVAGLLAAGPSLRRLRSRRVLAAAALVVAAVAAFLLSSAGTRLRTRVIWSAEDYQGGARPWLWRDALALGLRAPLTGHGPETFTAEYSRVRSQELAVRFPDQTEESPHNIFLDAWVARGLPGAAALLGLSAVVLLGARRRPSEAAAFAAALAANQFLSFTAMTEAMFLLAAVLAVAHGGAALDAKGRPGRALRLTLGAGALALAEFAGELFLGEVYAERARQALVAARVPEAVGLYLSAQKAAPIGGSYGEWFAGALYGAQASAPQWAGKALEALADGRGESPADAHYLKAALLAQAGRPPLEVETALHAAIDASPNWYKPQWKLAQALQLLDREAEALTWAESADRLAGETHPEVRATLESLRRR